MKKIIVLLLAATLVPGISFAKAASCEYRDDVVDPVTQEKTVRTKWEKITHDNEPGDPSTTVGRVSGVTEGDAVLLGVRIPINIYYPIPPELGIKLEDTNIITKKGKFDKRLDPYVEEWENTPIFVPTGSRLRITLADRTDVLLTTVRDTNAQAEVTMPQWGNNFSPYFRASANVELRYALNADDLASLTGQPFQSMRLETGDRYYTFGGRKLVWDNLAVNKKSKLNIQKVLKCVL